MNLLEKMRLKQKADSRISQPREITTVQLMEKIELNDKRYRRILLLTIALFVVSSAAVALYISTELRNQVIENRTTVQQSQDAQTQVLLDSQDTARKTAANVACLVTAIVGNRSGQAVIDGCQLTANDTQATPSQNFNHGTESGQTPGRTGDVQQRNQQAPQGNQPTPPDQGLIPDNIPILGGL